MKRPCRRPFSIRSDGFQRTEETVIPSTDDRITFKTGTILGLRVTNNSGKRICLTVFNISNDGAINVLYPRLGRSQEFIAAGNTPISTGLISLKRPMGTEYLKVIATLDFSHYSGFSQGQPRGPNTKGDARSPLDVIMDRSSNGAGSRGPLSESISVNRWAVISSISIIVNQ